MTTVTFALSVELKTGHPEYSPTALWLGRATITQETDYDDQDQPFNVDVSVITALWFCPDAQNPKFAHAVEWPKPTKDGFQFRCRLHQAAIAAYHNPKLQPAEMPDDETK